MAANQGLITANQEIQAAGNTLIRVTENALHAHHEQEDLREIVGRLESMVLDLLTEVRGLRGQQ